MVRSTGACSFRSAESGRISEYVGCLGNEDPVMTEGCHQLSHAADIVDSGEYRPFSVTGHEYGETRPNPQVPHFDRRPVFHPPARVHVDHVKLQSGILVAHQLRRRLRDPCKQHMRPLARSQLFGRILVFSPPPRPGGWPPEKGCCTGRTGEAIQRSAGTTCTVSHRYSEARSRIHARPVLPMGKPAAAHERPMPKEGTGELAYCACLRPATKKRKPRDDKNPTRSHIRPTPCDSTRCI